MVPGCVPAGILIVAFSFKRRHFNLGAERGLHKAHRHFAQQVVAVALKNLVGLEMQHHVKIAGGPPRKPASPLPDERRRAPVSTPAGNAQRDLGRAIPSAGAATRLARLLDHATGALSIADRSARC